MKPRKTMHRLLAWVLVVTVMMSSSANVWAAEQTESELSATVAEEETSLDTETQDQEMSETAEQDDRQEETETQRMEPETEEKKVNKKQPRTVYQLVNWLAGTPKIMVKQSDNTYTEVDPSSYVFTKGEAIKLYLSYVIPDSAKAGLSSADTLVYTLPNYLDNLVAVANGKIKDNAYTAGDAGTYTIDAAGNVELKFNQDYLAAGKVNGGDFSFEGTLNVNPNENGESELTFGDAKVTIKVNTEGTLNIEKDAERTVTEYYNDSEIKYTLKVSAPDLNPGTITGAVVKDSFRADIANFVKLDSYSFDGYTQSQDVWTDGNGNKITVNGTSFEWELKAMNPGDEISLTYTVSILKEVWREDPEAGIKGIVDHTIVNDAIVEIEGKKAAEDDASVLFYKQYVRKSHSHDDANGNSVFSLMVNWGGPAHADGKLQTDIEGETLTDTLSFGTLVGTVSVKRYNFSKNPEGKEVTSIDPNWSDTITGLAGQTSFSYMFNKNNGVFLNGAVPTDCRYGYMFTYAVKDENGYILNKVEMGEYGEEVEHWKLGVVKEYVSHERDADGKLWMDWRIETTGPNHDHPSNGWFALRL